MKKASEHKTTLVHVVSVMQDLSYWDGPAPEGSNRGTDDAKLEASGSSNVKPSLLSERLDLMHRLPREEIFGADSLRTTL